MGETNRRWTDEVTDDLNVQEADSGMTSKVSHLRMQPRFGQKFLLFDDFGHRTPGIVASAYEAKQQHSSLDLISTIKYFCRELVSVLTLLGTAVTTVYKLSGQI